MSDNAAPLSTPVSSLGRARAYLPSKRAFWLVGTLVMIWIAISWFSPSFFSIRMTEDGRLLGSLIDIFNRSASIMLLSIGMTLVIATKGIDLSVGAVVAISGAVAAVLIPNNPPIVAITAALIAGLICGIWNGILVALLDIQPIIATLILMVVGRGIAQMITGGQIAVFNDQTLAGIGTGTLFGFPVPVYIAVMAFIAVSFFVRRTAVGLMIESVGANDRASYYAGINARLIKLMVYALSGLCAAVAGLILTGYIKGADANNAGLWSELDAILAVVIGGTALSGGRFYLGLSMIGALIIQSLYTGILVSGLKPELNLVIKAGVILGILLLQSDDFRNAITRPVQAVRLQRQKAKP